MDLARQLIALLLTLSCGALAAEPGWLYYGGDQGGRHYSEAAQIDRANVGELEVAWVFRSGDSANYGTEMAKTSTQSTPILLPAAAGESLVYCTPFNRVIALDPATGPSAAAASVMPRSPGSPQASSAVTVSS